MSRASIPHGTRNGYNYHGCRCQSCREANATYQRAKYEQGYRTPPKVSTPKPRGRPPVLGPPAPTLKAPPRERELVHGTRSGYSHHGCRCASCLAANNAYQRERYRKKRETGWKRNR